MPSSWSQPAVLDPSFASDLGANAGIASLEPLPSGGFLVGGQFTQAGGAKRNYVAMITPDGQVDPSFNPDPGPNAGVWATLHQSDGKVVIGGQFGTVNGSAQAYLARLNADGSVDASFKIGSGPNNIVTELVKAPNGDVLVGGLFTAFDGSNRGALVRLKPNGNLDLAFNPMVVGRVDAVAIRVDGKILIGGDFRTVGGIERNRVARLNADGSLDASFDPGDGPNAGVWAVLQLADGGVMIGGSFGQVNGATAPYLSKLRADGLPEIQFNGQLNSVVYALALQPDGRILVGGLFGSVQGQERNRIARLRADGTLDTSFESGGVNGADGEIAAVAVQLDGKILVGGNFARYGGVERERLARVEGLNSAVGGELEFSQAVYRVSEGTPSLTIEVRRTGSAGSAVTLDYASSSGTANAGDYTPQTGKLIFAAGELSRTFTMVIRPDTQLEDDETVNLALSNPTGGAVLGGQRTAVMVIENDDKSNVVGISDGGFRAKVIGGVVNDIAVQADGKLVLVGTFYGVNDFSRLRIARLDAGGRLDESFRAQARLNAEVQAVAVQSDGKIVVGGSFSEANGEARSWLARFHMDGTLDPGFLPPREVNGPVYELMVRPEGDVVVGGAFGMIRLFSDGSVDPSFEPRVAGAVHAFDLREDGKWILGGAFTSVGGVGRNRVARLHGDGTLDMSFDPGGGPNSTVEAVVIQPDGKVVIGGHFSMVHGLIRPYVARLEASGAPDGEFDARLNGVVYALVPQPDGKLWVGGSFTQADGQEWNRLVRLRSDGAPDPSVANGGGANQTVQALARQQDGRVVVGGAFTRYGGLTWEGILRVEALSSASGGELEFSQGKYRVNEAAPHATIQVTRLGNTSTAVVVDYATSNGTANAGDYTPQSGKLSFAAGEQSKSFVIPIRPDTQPEDDETVNLTLNNPTSGAVLGGQRTALLTIEDDDSSGTVGAVEAGFRANATGGAVHSVALQPDGKVVLTGDFSVINHRGRWRLGRLLPDGNVDESFNASTWLNGSGEVVAVQPDGKVLVGGSFTEANGERRNRLARFHVDGTLDAGFSPGTGPNGPVHALLFEADGDILVGGAFSTFHGENLGSLVRLFSDGSVDATFNPGVEGAVHALVSDGSGHLFVGGAVTKVKDVIRKGVARLSRDGVLDRGFDPGAGPDSTVQALAVRPDGTLLVGGSFSTLNGLAQPYFGRLHANGLPDATFQPEVQGAVYACAVQPDGRIVIGGSFTRVQGETRNRLARLRGDGALDISFAGGEGANNQIRAIALQPDGKLIVGGLFTLFDGYQRESVTRVEGLGAASGGEVEFSQSSYQMGEGGGTLTVQVRRIGNTGSAVTVDYASRNGSANAGDYIPATGRLIFGVGELSKTFNVVIRSDVLVEAEETFHLTLSNPTGGALLGGQRTALVTIADDDVFEEAGRLDMRFVSRVAGGAVHAIAVQPDGKVVLGGNFTSVNGMGRLRVARLNPDGNLDPAFLPSAWANGKVETIALQADGTILMGGNFTQVNGEIRNYLARLLEDGTLDPGFSTLAGPNGVVLDVFVQADGDILVAGSFSRFDGEVRQGLARLFSDGSVDPTFDARINGTVQVLRSLGGGKLLVAGEFTEVGGVPRMRVARLQGGGGLDESFDPLVGPNSTVQSLWVESDGRLVIGGSFTQVAGKSLPYLARLLANGAVDESWTGKANNVVAALGRPHGRLLAGGPFTQINGTTENGIVGLTEDGEVDAGFVTGTGAKGQVFTMAQGLAGQIFVGGDFTEFDDLPRANFVVLQTAAPTVAFAFSVIRVEGGQVKLFGTGKPNARYTLQVTEDFKNWSTVSTFAAAGADFQVSDGVGARPRFYRLMLVE